MSVSILFVLCAFLVALKELLYESIEDVNIKEISAPQSPKSNSCSFDLDKNEINSDKLQSIFKFNNELIA
jgi:hypothetical protein